MTNTKQDIATARRVIDLESDGLDKLCDSIGGVFCTALDILEGTKGNVVLTGMGKSGHIARKMAATFSSTGTPAFYVHPGEANHGDMGTINDGDTLIAISNSGETIELANILTYAGQKDVPVIAITKEPQSALAKAAFCVLILPDYIEACPSSLAPTTSTTMTLALGDALAICLMERKGFTADAFSEIHPGGGLSKRFMKVDDFLRDVPNVMGASDMKTVVSEITRGCIGCVAVNDGEGIITDGDLRRHMDNDFMFKTAADIATWNPLSIHKSARASEAVDLMQDHGVTALLVRDGDKLIGAVRIYDMMKEGVE